MAPEKRETTEQPAAARELPSPEQEGPLPADVLERYSAEGLDMAGLTDRDAEALKAFESQPFQDNGERLRLLKELVPKLREQSEKRRGEKPAEPADELERMAGTVAPTEGAKVIELPTAAAKAGEPEQPEPFDAEAELQELMHERAGIEAKVAALPEAERAAAREKMHQKFSEHLEQFKQEALEQRRAMTRLIETVREQVLSNIETESGLPMDEMIELADRAADPKDGPEAVKAAKKIKSLRRPLKWSQITRKEWWTRGIPVEEIMTPKAAELDGTAIMEAVKEGSAAARLTPDQREAVDRMVETIIDRRQAIKEAREQAPTPEALYQLCFGREPYGKVTVVEGPVTLYFRCQDEDDYALIHSQEFAQGKLSVSKEQRFEAMKSGGVSISASRADSPALEKDEDLQDVTGKVDEERLADRRRLLTRLGGAIIAENNVVPRSFMHRWNIYRHEEQHAVKAIMGEFELRRTAKSAAREVLELMDIAKEENAGAAEILTKIHTAEDIRKGGRDPEAEIKQLHDRLAELEKRGKTADSMMKERLGRYVEDSIESRAKDEILAYYLEGRLNQAVEIYEMELKETGPVDPTQPVEIDLIPPYLKRSRSEGGLYDYHSESNVAERIFFNVVSEMESINAEAEGEQGDVEASKAAAEEATETEKTAEAKQPSEDEAEAEIESRQSLANDMKGVVAKVLESHRERYGQVLDQALGAIETMEKAGFGKQEIIDTLALEPLRRWPRLAARLAKQERQAAAGRQNGRNKEKMTA